MSHSGHPSQAATMTTPGSHSILLPGPTISSNDFEELRRDISNMKMEFDHWIETQKQHLHEKNQRHFNIMSAEQQTLETLERQHEDLLRRGHDLRQSILKAQEDAIVMERDLQELDVTKGAMSERRHTVQKRLQELLSKIQQETHVVEQCEHAKDLRKSEASRGVEYFQDRLGLQFTKQKDGCLKFTFTQLDPMDPMREMSFTMFVDEHDIYHVVQCDPPIEDIQVLVENLNQDNQFNVFAKSIRNRFKTMCVHD